jgi:tetratricopeptide (TPR) repeat protein
MLQNLRTLSYQQQFDVLVLAAKCYYLEGGDLEALLLQGLAHAHLGEHEEARALLDQVQARRHELSFEAQVDLGAALLQLGETAQADLLLRAAARQMPQQLPQQAYARANLAWLAEQKGRAEEALEGYRQAFAQMPGLVMVWSSLVRLLLDMRLAGEAQEVLEHAQATFLEAQAHLEDPVALQQKASLDLLQWEIWCATGQYATAESWLSDRVADLDVADVFREALIRSRQAGVLQRMPARSMSLH